MRPTGTIALAQGWQVQIEALLVEQSMGDILEGDPDRIWDEVVRSAADDAIRVWGQRRSHVIAPVSMSASRRLLPPWKVSVWLVSDAIDADTDAHGSDLIVVFFAKTILDQAPLALVRAAIAELNWPAIAGDFEY